MTCRSLWVSLLGCGLLNENFLLSRRELSVFPEHLLIEAAIFMNTYTSGFCRPHVNLKSTLRFPCLGISSCFWQGSVHIRRPFVKPHNSDLFTSSKIKLSCVNAQKVIFILLSMVHSATTKDAVTIHSVTLGSPSASLVVQCAASWEFCDLQTLTSSGRESVAGSASARSVVKEFTTEQRKYMNVEEQKHHFRACKSFLCGTKE